MRRVLPLLLCAALRFLPTSGVAGEPADSSTARPPREQGLPFIETFDRRDYRGHAQVWCGAVDAQGLLYFGNHAQVLVYDGVQWDRIAIPGATFVRSLAFDSSGRLWVGAFGALGYIDPAAAGPAKFISLADRLPAAAQGPGEIARVLVFGDSVYFQSATWLFRWQNGTMKGWPLPPGPPTQSLIVAGELLLQNPFDGWRRPGANGLEPSPSPLPWLPPTRFALPLPDDRWLFGTIFNGLFLGTGRTAARHRTAADPLFTSNFLFSALPLRDGRFALNMLTGGTVILDADLSFQTLIDEAAGLPSSTVNHAFADAHGGLWLCLGDGIARVADTFAATWFRPPSPFGRIDRDALARFRGQLYLGVAPELRRLTPSAHGTGTATWELSSVLGSRHGGRFGALLDAGDTLLIAAADGCYTWRENEDADLVSPLRDGSALLASVAQPGRYFVAHASGIDALRRTGDRWIAEGPVVAVDRAVRTLHETTDGTLWAGLAGGGVVRVNLPSNAAPVVEHFGEAHGLPIEPREIRIVPAAQHPLFVTARGLLRFDAEKKRFVPDAGYGSNFADGTTAVRAAVENAHGDLWLAPEPAGDDRPWAETTLGRATRRGEWFPLALPDLGRIGDILGLRLERDNGREVLWAVGVSGVLRVELDAAPAGPSAGATLIRSIVSLADRTPLPAANANAPAVLPYTQNSLRFRIAAPGLAALRAVQFETQIVGFAQGARQLGASAEREFTNLGEGSYTFRARARADDGRWTTPAEFSFVILPPWWRTPWAYAAVIVLTLAGIAGFVQIRTRALRLRTAQLEHTVAARTHELHAHNQELARLHKLELDEKISARLAEEKARLEMLRYQLNPHFLFNTLNSLYSLVAEHPTAAHMVLRLSEFCRLTLTRGPGHAQTLGDELHMLTAYLDIEKVRWGDSLQIAIDVDASARATPLPPFLLLPLVENAIKYGGQTSPDVLQLRLAARLAGDGALEIEIANTGHWLATGASTAPSTHIGLENLRERLARSYPGSHIFDHTSGDGWVRVRLCLNRARTPIA